jgi:beta-glucosidase
LPQALEDKFGGWRSRETCKAFADYCSYTAGKLADRITHFMTMNEMSAFVDGGYGDGHSAPGLRLDAAGVAQVSHNVVLAHGMAVKAIRASGRAGTRVGIPSNAVATVPVIETTEHIEAAKIAFREQNAPFLTVIMEGKYTDRYLRRLGPSAPKHTPEDLATIAAPLDFVGLNIYTATYVRAAQGDAGYEIVPTPASYPHMSADWLKIGPEAMYWAPRLCHELWDVKEIYITENGCSADDQISHEGRIDDSDRVMFLRNYLTQLQRAPAEDIPVKGYFLWSLLDNFEWASGYSKRFGIVYVDYRTHKRTPKLSYDFYRAVISRGELV